MPDRLPDDFLFITQFNVYAKTTTFVHKSVYNWRLHPESTWHKNKHENPWRGYNLIENELNYFKSLQQEYNDRITERDIEDLKLYLVKNYCYYLIHDISSIKPWKKARQAYNKLRGLMLSHVPHYAGLIFRRTPWNSPFRSSLHWALCLLCLLEIAHCLFPALMVYGFVAFK